MSYTKNENKLTVNLIRDFNLMTAKKLENLAEDVDEIYIDLSKSRLVDSEAIIVLYKLLNAKKIVKLKNPPPIFCEVVRILELDDFFKMEHLIDNEC